MLPPRPLSRSLAGNIFSAAFARVWQVGLQFAVTPVYMALLGPGGYGLVGFNMTLLLVLAFLDQAVSPVVVREFGRLEGKPGAAPEMRNLLRSMEVVSVSTAVLIGVAVLVLAPFIGGDWINAGAMPRAEVVAAVQLMGLTLACQWPSFLYGNGFVGLHRQALVSGLRVVFSSLQAAGAVAALLLIAPTASVLFAWQAASFALFSLVLGGVLWRTMPAADVRPRLDPVKLRSVWRFALGTLMIGAMTSVLTQADNLIVSKYVPLDQFAAYSLCFMLAMQVSVVMVSPVSSVLLPLFARLIADGDEAALAREYHRWTQVVAFLILPTTGVLVVFGKPLMQIWLGAGSPMIEPVCTLLPWVMLGTMFNALVTAPLCLQLAAGWTRLITIYNMVVACLFLLALVMLVPRYGAIAGALCWLAVNASYFLALIPLMHRRLLPAEMLRWWACDTLLPMAVTAAVFGVSQALVPARIEPWSGAGQAVATALLAAGALTLAMPRIRAAITSLLGRLFRSPARD